MPRPCPRCGIRLDGVYKFCPNCAYRLRPDLVPAETGAPQAAATQGARLVALGGYLAFVSLLLLVVLAGIQLFVQPASELEPIHRRVFDVGPLRDVDALRLERSQFTRVDSGETFWGLYTLDGTAPDPIWVDDPFEISIYEVTNDQFFEFLVQRAARSGKPAPGELIPVHWKRQTNRADVARIYEKGAGNQPATNVPFLIALEFTCWVWETLFDGDPDVVVDLPSYLEFVLAGRGRGVDGLKRNWPWGPHFRPGRANVATWTPVDVNAERIGEFDGIFGLIGNAGEWVHDPDLPQVAAVAGHSFLPREAGYERHTPFGPAGFERRGADDDVGFRLVVRRAPRLPRMIQVAAGPVRYGTPPLHHIRPTNVAVRVERDFEIARTAVTNRQYLAFLVARSKELADLDDLLPDSLKPPNGRPNPYLEYLVPVVYRGIYDTEAEASIPRLYWAGDENLPLTGVSVEQARAYATWLTETAADPQSVYRLPRVEEYVRAGRASHLRPYPWGKSANDLGMNSREYSNSRAEQARPISLWGRYGDQA
ncbi:MAG: SUMF1/EgtB/PvdO family nonheme iron enzyme, partial [Planctomycetota bacterium]|nr:SUMF1/EgtB/PvdO family nonheme iron enzyme [Planctomycetota bacterium]